MNESFGFSVEVAGGAVEAVRQNRVILVRAQGRSALGPTA